MANMRGTRRKIALITILAMLGSIAGTLLPHPVGISHVFAADIPVQPEPERLRIEPIYDTEPNVQPPIGYNEYDEYYVDLKWDPLRNPVPNIAINKYMNFYLQEVTKPYMPAKPVILKERDILADNVTSLRMRRLTSGTIYYTYARAYYTYRDELNGNIYKSPESAPSNTVKFLTDINLEAYPYGIKQIKIVWDDVWTTTGRINYRLYVSEDKSFTNTPPIYIESTDIGEGRPVSVNEDTGKLEYIHTVRDAGRVYYIKIVPDIVDPELKYSKESNIVAVSSYILARTTKIASTPEGNIWRIEWSPVVTGLNTGDITITYQIYRGILDSSEFPTYMAAVDDTTFITTLSPQDENIYYFIIRASVTRNGEDLYPGIRIESDKIIIKESEVPAVPIKPELVNEFRGKADNVIISYEDELKPDEATVLWRFPETGEGKVDSNVVYDMWLIKDPNTINNPAPEDKIADSLAMRQSNYVMDGSDLIGYKYTISNLEPNTVYYFKIVAKKTFIQYNEDGFLEEVTLVSEPAIRIIKTPSEDITDRPVAPGRPPLRLKKDPQRPGKYLITETTAVIQLKNKWYEHYNTETGKWEYIEPQDIDPSILNALEKGEHIENYRIVEYDSGVTIDVGCVEYKEDMTYNDLYNLPADKVKNFPTTPNDPYEDAGLNPDGKKHNIDIAISGLKPNTSYVIWVRAVRAEYDLMSDPSDPIIITTNPEIPIHTPKPTVPVFTYYIAGDDFVSLAWDFKVGYTYYIKYGTVDDIDSAKEEIEIKPEDLFYSTYYTITGLEQQTMYYFWIRAEIEATPSPGTPGSTPSERISSDWSDSLAVRTLPYVPPETPKGFGVKNTDDAITIDSITYEWIPEDNPNIEYILEISENPEFEDSVEINVGKVSEYKVSGLRSNFRYYARLYAYDTKKELRSEPTQPVIARTLRSRADYDSDEYVEDVIKGEYIVKEYVKKDDLLNVYIQGVNADRFVEDMRNDDIVDYVIDLFDAPKTTKYIRLVISNKVFEAMEQLKENIIAVYPGNKLTLTYGMFRNTDGTIGLNELDNFDYEVIISLSTSNRMNIEQDKYAKLKADPVGIKAGAMKGQLYIPYYSFNRPAKLIYESFESYEIIQEYQDNLTGVIYDHGLGRWEKIGLKTSYEPNSDLWQFIIDVNIPGEYALAFYSRDVFDDISASRYRDQINNVASVHTLKSVKGRLFFPGNELSIEDAVKLALDVMDYDYDDQYLRAAYRSSIIQIDDMENPYKGCTREKALAIAARLYELKTGEKAAPSSTDVYPFKDMDKVSPHLFNKVLFAAQNGFMSDRYSDMLNPDEVILRGEFIGILEKVLKLAGEI